MRGKRGLFGLLAVVLFSLTVFACETTEPAFTTVPLEPTSTPGLKSAIEPRAEAPGRRTPTPTPVPPEERKVVLDFARGHATITRDWEQFHADFDSWREGLIACDASAREVDLRQFAGSFSSVTEKARALPSSASIRALADKLIEAVEREE